MNTRALKHLRFFILLASMLLVLSACFTQRFHNHDHAKQAKRMQHRHYLALGLVEAEQPFLPQQQCMSRGPDDDALGEWESVEFEVKPLNIFINLFASPIYSNWSIYVSCHEVKTKAKTEAKAEIKTEAEQESLTNETPTAGETLSRGEEPAAEDKPQQ